MGVCSLYFIVFEKKKNRKAVTEQEYKELEKTKIVLSFKKEIICRCTQGDKYKNTHSNTVIEKLEIIEEL